MTSKYPTSKFMSFKKHWLALQQEIKCSNPEFKAWESLVRMLENRPEKTPYLDTFHVVLPTAFWRFQVKWKLISSVK